MLLSPHPHGGPSRYEGAPFGDASSYEVVKTHGHQTYVLGSRDALAPGGSMALRFGPDDWCGGGGGCVCVCDPLTVTCSDTHLCKSSTLPIN